MKKAILICSLLLISLITSCQTNDINRLKDYSLNFNLDEIQKENIPKIDVNYVDWDKIIKNSIKSDSLKANVYLTIVPLKLYKAHLNCCNQAYTLNKTPIIENFLNINGFYKSGLVKNLPKGLVSDLIRSDLVYEWLKGRVDFLNENYLRIKKEEEVIRELEAIDTILK